MLKDKRVQQVHEVARPHLRPGEQVQLVSYVSVRPRRMYLATTQDRLLFFNGDTPSGKPGRSILMEIPRPLITVASAKKGVLTFTVRLAVEGEDQGVKLIFPRPTRDDGETLAAEIPAAPQPA